MGKGMQANSKRQFCLRMNISQCTEVRFRFFTLPLQSVLFICLSSLAVAQTTIFDVAEDWSNTSNPNGVWTYTGDNGALLTTNIPDWEPDWAYQQPAWADAAQPNPGHTPMWYKSLEDRQDLDVPADHVGMHGSTGAWVGAVWTSPFTGGVDISGGVWHAAKTIHPTRNANWRLRINDTVLTEGEVTANDAFDSVAPFDLQTGSGGANPLTGLVVFPGDEIVLEFNTFSGFATFLGVDFRISEADIPLQIQTEDLPFAVDGEPYTFNLTAILGQPPFNWEIVSGSLPEGLALTPAGNIDGTPSESGDFTFTVRVIDNQDISAEKTFGLEVYSEGLYDLARDWSDFVNPNGTWSYNGARGIPIVNHINDWDPVGDFFNIPQPAWATAPWPNTGHVPFWLKVVPGAVTPGDLPSDRVIMHGTDSGDPVSRAGVTWTSPIDDVVTIDGGVWLALPSQNRSMDWHIYLNSVLLTSGSLTPEVSGNSFQPLEFEDGTNGPSVLTQEIAIGDVITLEFEKKSQFDAFVGVDLTILSSFVIDSVLPEYLRLGEHFEKQLHAVAGLAPLSWSVIDGQLPAGLTLSSSGLLDGAPIDPGIFDFTLQVIDGNNEVSTEEFTIEVSLILPPAQILINKEGTIVVPGRQSSYFITVENTGATIAKDILVREVFDPVAQFTDPSLFVPSPTFVFGNQVQWTIDKLDPGGIELLSYSVTISPSVNIGDIVNGKAYEFCEACQTHDDCRFAPTLCENLGTPLPTGVGLADIVEQLIKPLNLDPACQQKLDDCTKRCCERCPEDSDNKPADGPIDPNEKLAISNRYVRPGETLKYAIYFENIGAVEAIDVFLTDILDDNLDESTLALLSQEEAVFSPSSRTLRWNLLDRNLQPGETGHVLFSIAPKPNLPSGTEIRNSAEIQFEIFDPLTTPEVVNIIDSEVPNCVVDALPAQVPTLQFDVFWSGSDVVGEIDTYSVFAAENSGAYELVYSGQDTSMSFTGIESSFFDFFCVARDTAGNMEAQVIASEATTIVLPDLDSDGILDGADNCTDVPNGPDIPDAGENSQLDTDNDGYGNACDPDFNGNGIVDPFDFSLLKSRFGQTGFPDQDLNGNEIVDPADFSKLKSMFGQPPGPSGLAP